MPRPPYKAQKYVADLIGADKVSLGSDYDDGHHGTPLMFRGLPLIMDELKNWSIKRGGRMMGGNVRDFMLRICRSRFFHLHHTLYKSPKQPRQEHYALNQHAVEPCMKSEIANVILDNRKHAANAIQHPPAAVIFVLMTLAARECCHNQPQRRPNMHPAHLN